MYDELITALRACVDKDKGCSECPYCERCMNNTSGKHAAMVDAADAIEELQEDNAALNGTVSNLIGQIAELSKPRWIPVTERLPKDEKDVLAYYGFKHDGVLSDQRFIGTLCYFRFDPTPHWQHEGQGKLTVTHWMQLPEPPEEES